MDKKPTVADIHAGQVWKVKHTEDEWDVSGVLVQVRRRGMDPMARPCLLTTDFFLSNWEPIIEDGY